MTFGFQRNVDPAASWKRCLETESMLLLFDLFDLQYPQVELTCLLRAMRTPHPAGKDVSSMAVGDPFWMFTCWFPAKESLIAHHISEC